MPAVRALASLEDVVRGAGAGDEPTLACSICLESFQRGERAVYLPCHSSHAFHTGCLRPALGERAWQSVCPLCRSPIFP
eukprot:5723724-Pyramimonas_sp.AAC.1